MWHFSQGLFICQSVFLFSFPLGLRGFSLINISIFFLSFSLGYEVFHRLQRLVFSSLPSSYKKEVFLTAYRSCHISSSLLEKSFQSPYYYLHTQQSLRLRAEAIIMLWHTIRLSNRGSHKDCEDLYDTFSAIQVIGMRNMSKQVLLFIHYYLSAIIYLLSFIYYHLFAIIYPLSFICYYYQLSVINGISIIMIWVRGC